MSIGFKWWEKTRDINSKEFKQALKDTVNSKKRFDTYMYLCSFSDLDIEKKRLKDILNTNN